MSNSAESVEQPKVSRLFDFATGVASAFTDPNFLRGVAMGLGILILIDFETWAVVALMVGLLVASELKEVEKHA